MQVVLDAPLTFRLTCVVFLSLDLHQLDLQQGHQQDHQVGLLGWMDRHQVEWALVRGQQLHR